MKKNILLVDENKAITYLIENNLSKSYTTRSVENSYYAMQAIVTDQPYDLFIIDVDAPNSENFQFLQHIATSSFFKNSPVIILSKSTDETFLENCKSMGNVTVLPKPFDPVILNHKVNHILRNTEAGQIIRKKRKLFNLNFY